MYNRNLRRVKRRFNPNTPTMYTDIDPQEPVAVTYFKSAAAARAFLIRNYDVANNTTDEELLKKLKDAQDVIDAADKRNLRRQVQSLSGLGRTPRIKVLTPEQILLHDKIAQQLARLKITPSKFLKWCGFDDDLSSKETQDICHRLTNILREKCEGHDLSAWEREGCENQGYCSTNTKRILPELEEVEAAPVEEIPEFRYNPVGRRAGRRGTEKNKRRRGKKPSPGESTTSSKLHKWEEVLGPNGELVRFKVIRSRKDKKRKERTTEKPAISDIVLDMTTGCHAFKITRGGRVEVPLNEEMQRVYKGSFLYQIRCLAAGEKTPHQVWDRILNMFEIGSGIGAKKTPPKEMPPKKRLRKKY